MKTVIFGGGGLAAAIHKKLPDSIVFSHKEVDVTSAFDIDIEIDRHEPENVINCAGIANPAPIAKSKPALWEKELKINLYGSYLVSKTALRHEVKRIILIGSVSALYGKADWSGYSASKAGVIAMTRALADEGHAVYCVSPGRIDTPLRAMHYPSEDPATRLSPSQVADVIRDVIDDEYEPGDNVIIRRKGMETIIEVDRSHRL